MDKNKKEETGISVSSHLKIIKLDTNEIIYDGRIKDGKDAKSTSKI